MILSTLSVAVFAFLLEGLDSKALTVKKGEDATLECDGLTGAAIILLRWKNPSLHSDYYVFYYSDEEVHEDKQHELFKGRVQLRDPEMKNGDLSVILKNVSVNDTGIYECYAGYAKQKLQLMNSITLKVEEPALTVQKGEDATLECDGLTGADIMLLQWKNPSVHSDYYVFYYNDNQVHEDKQHELFKGRVQLRHPKMKDGDLSVILKNVSVNDTGIYECYAGYGNQVPQFINSTNLTVEEPGQPGGHTDNGGKECVPGVIVGLLTLILLVPVV